MSDGISLDLHASLIVALSQSSAVSELVGNRIYDVPPPSRERVWPYLTLGAIEPLPTHSDGAKSETVIFSIEAHSKDADGRVEATRLAQAVKKALDGNPIEMETHHMVSINWMTQTIDRTTARESHHANIVFSSLIDE